MQNKWREWYESALTTVYIGFILYELSSAFRRLFHHWWEWLKPRPRVILTNRLEKELREIIEGQLGA